MHGKCYVTYPYKYETIHQYIQSLRLQGLRLNQNMSKTRINIMQANLTLLRYHGLWPTYLDFQKDKYYKLKVILVSCAVSVLWYSSTFHLLSIIAGKF